MLHIPKGALHCKYCLHVLPGKLLGFAHAHGEMSSGAVAQGAWSSSTKAGRTVRTAWFSRSKEDPDSCVSIGVNLN